jgi:hypothetical protein
MEQQKGLISHWTDMSNPARSNARSNPPIPLKKDAKVGFITLSARPSRFS